jgi:hypothetical protein
MGCAPLPGAAYGLKAFKSRAAGIAVIVLKGTFLAEVDYENIGLRTIGDIDLLVKKERSRLGYDILHTHHTTPQHCDLTEWHEEKGRLLTHMHRAPKHGLSIEVTGISKHVQDSFRSPDHKDFISDWKDK